MTATSNPPVLDVFVPQLYDELRAMAHCHLRGERRPHTLGTTALVHEAWLRLSAQYGLPREDVPRFFAAASNTMRRVLVDHARRRHRLKRGAGGEQVSLEEAEESLFLSESEADELVALDDALERLGRVSARGVEVIQHRFFGGLSVEETAQLLDVSTKTVQREWVSARAWLRKEIARDLGFMR